MRHTRSLRPGAALVAALIAAAAVASGCGGEESDGTGKQAAHPDVRGSSASGSAADSPPASSAPRSGTPTGPPSPALPDSVTRQKLSWSRCPEPNAAQGTDAGSPSPLPGGTRWECAELKVPLDYDEPKGRTIGIAMIRATERKGGGKRIGSLLFNFGGPGGSGVATLPAFARDYEKLRGRYDLVSFDPRGVGRSEGVKCLSNKKLDGYFAADWTPDTDSEQTRLFDRQENFADGCEKRAGTLLPHLTTENTARDMDVMRQVLGDEKLHYFGISYGTELGGVYAHLYPRKVGRAVFDAVVDPRSTPVAGSLSQTSGFQLALDNFLKACAARGEDCPVGEDPDEGKQRITDLLAELDAEPMPTDSGRKLTESLAEGGIAQALYAKDTWQLLARGLQEALVDGDGSTLLLLADALNGRNQDGTYSTLQSSLTAISCADNRQRYGAREIKSELPGFTEASPVFGPMSAWGLSSCHDWPVRGQWTSPPVGADGAAPILLVGTTGDPATPYGGTRAMKKELGEGVGVEVTYRGEGHGAYDSDNTCVRRAVDGYLLRGKVPEDGTNCR
ncbi:alpha/beta hydrolase [Streptomyces tubbatahanensis]|uniref:Alpha/beta hydrolase n=1 Tax=Streptomyces tubbatahanensis TaxID=2923272 RepID=A0ABY3XWS3_9ACTN|nr:alpha/beta hydrolase [Streptomyces tubbatahanensis]UNS98829.1 alpha/beta hydrolase [Streptomyces tubbatahanensis]